LAGARERIRRAKKTRGEPKKSVSVGEVNAIDAIKIIAACARHICVKAGFEQ
jgi:hypothetical protein